MPQIGQFQKYFQENLLKLVAFIFGGTKWSSKRQLLFILNETRLQVLRVLTVRSSYLTFPLKS